MWISARKRAGIVAGAFLFGFGSVLAQGTKEPATAGDVVDVVARAWQDRQDRITSARFKWVQIESYVKGYLSARLGGQAEVRIGQGPVPPQDVSFDGVQEY